MENKYGFVYLWRDLKHKRYYLGCHWGTVDDGYICSSNWMRDSYKRRPEDFKRRILKTNILDRKQLLIEEFYFLSMIKNKELGKRYYNLSNRHFGHWSINEESRLTSIERMKLSIKSFYENGGINHFTGKKHTEETKKIIKEKRSQQIFNEETIEKRKRFGKDNHFHGKTHSKNVKEIIKQKSKDLWKDQEYRSLVLKNREGKQGLVKDRSKNKNFKGYVITPSGKYISISEAAVAEKLGWDCISYRVNSKKEQYKDYYYQKVISI